MAKALEMKKVWSRGEAEGFTPYMVARIVNEALGQRGLELIKPQMMYNYDRNGLINGTKYQIQERGYNTSEVIAFRDKFVQMRASKARKASAVQVIETEECEGQQDLLEMISES